MSSQENERVKVVRDILAGRRTQAGEAERLGVTARAVRYWIASFEKDGAEGLVHGNRGKESPRRVPEKERERIASVIRERYQDFGPTLAAEKLAELHGISRDPKTVRSIMVEEKIWVPGKRGGRAAAVHRAWRERRGTRGELVQFDGSYHPWLEDRFADASGSHELCLLASVDDATGELLLARLAEHEGTLPVMGYFTEYAGEHGLPASVYLDRFSTYKMTQDVAVQNPDLRTQLQRAMETLGVKLVFALSPQAKGRVERLFKTLQDRLVKELRIRKISTVAEANAFLAETFVPAFNRKYRVEPRVPGDAHRPLTGRELSVLPQTLCRMESRVLQNDFTVSFEGQWFQILKTPGLAIRPGDPVVVRRFPDGSLSLSIRNRTANMKPIPKRTRPGRVSRKKCAQTLAA